MIVYLSVYNRLAELKQMTAVDLHTLSSSLYFITEYILFRTTVYNCTY